jgi:hypothetical protein
MLRFVIAFPSSFRRPSLIVIPTPSGAEEEESAFSPRGSTPSRCPLGFVQGGVPRAVSLPQRPLRIFFASLAVKSSCTRVQPSSDPGNHKSSHRVSVSPW